MAANLLLERLRRVHPAGPGRWVALCPAHPDRTPSLSIRLEGDKILIHCFAGCPAEAVLTAVNLTWADLHRGHARPWEAPGYYRPGPAPATSNAERRRYLERLWAEAQPIQDSLVGRRYLEARGLILERVLEGLHLRVHPALPYREGGEVLDAYPALLGRVERLLHGLVALHRTYLAPDGGGKAAVQSPKKLTPPVLEGATAGAAIRLFEHRPGEPLALAEGVETALAVHQSTGWPCWACVSAGGLERVELPAEAREVVIAADHDKAGLEAGRKLARRLLGEGRRVRMATPPVQGQDWLDVVAAGEVAR